MKTQFRRVLPWKFMYNVELAAEVDGRPLAAIAGGGFRAMPAAPRPCGDANLLAECPIPQAMFLMEMSGPACVRP